MNIRKLLALSIVTICYSSLQFASRELPELPLTPPMQKVLDDLTLAVKTKSAEAVIALIEKHGKQEGFNLEALVKRPDKSGKTLYEYILEMKDYEKVVASLESLVGIDFTLFAKIEIDKALKNAKMAINNEPKGKGNEENEYMRTNINNRITALAQSSKNVNTAINNILEASKTGQYSKSEPKQLRMTYQAAIVLSYVLDSFPFLLEVFD